MPEDQETTDQWRKVAARGVRAVFESVVAKVVASVLVGVMFGAAVGRATVDDKATKGLFAEIEHVVSRDGGRGLGRDVRVSGTATPALPTGFEMRYAVMGDTFWYPLDRALMVVDGHWELDDSLGSVDDPTLFTLAIIFGKTSDFTSWSAGERASDRGLATGPTDHGLYGLADRRVRRVR